MNEQMRRHSIEQNSQMHLRSDRDNHYLQSESCDMTAAVDSLTLPFLYHLLWFRNAELLKIFYWYCVYF